MALGSTDDLDFILADAGVAVTYGVQSCYGLLNKQPVSVDADGMSVNEKEHSVTIRDGALTGLTADGAITVDGTSYKVVDIGVALTDGTRRIPIIPASP